ncbi:MAG: hypothetical protein IPP14_09710 [Planctomycetes bacterium]|nr:hypothetical protein [Planctomycetota bacterium]
MKLDMLIKSVFAIAALLAAGTYAYNTLLDRAQPVQAGVDNRDGFEVLGLGFSAQGGFICVSKFSEDPTGEGKVNHTLTFYELKKQGADGEAKLFYVGSRSITNDSGLPLIKFREADDKDYSPNALKEAFEKANKGKKR